MPQAQPELKKVITTTQRMTIANTIIIFSTAIALLPLLTQLFLCIVSRQAPPNPTQRLPPRHGHPARLRRLPECSLGRCG